MISTIKSDEIFPLCDGAYVIDRTWKILDACKPLGTSNPVIHHQAIKVLDKKSPILYPCPSDMVVSTGAWNCYADSIKLPLPEMVFDYCGKLGFKAFMYGGGYIKVKGSLSNDSLTITGNPYIEG